MGTIDDAILKALGTMPEMPDIDAEAPEEELPSVEEEKAAQGPPPATEAAAFSPKHMAAYRIHVTAANLRVLAEALTGPDEKLHARLTENCFQDLPLLIETLRELRGAK